MSYYVIHIIQNYSNLMSAKNKQYKIEKGLLLFTQPRSPYFYGKIRLNRKYVTKSFAPITDLEEAKIMLFEWRKELLSQSTIPTSTITSPENFKTETKFDVILNMEIVEHVEDINFFLESSSKLLKKKWYYVCCNNK